MRRLATCMMLLLFSGCNLQLPGLRFEPIEETKQSAQVAADLAGPLSVTGSPPGSLASQKLASAARTQSSYVGPPAEPIDVSPLLDEATTKMWATINAQVEALATRGRVDDVGEQYVAAKASEILDAVAGQTQVDSSEIIGKTQALVDMAAMGKAIKAEIRVPADPETSEADLKIQEQLAVLIDEGRAQAQEHAARKPTVGEAADKVEEAVDSTLDRLTGYVEKYGLILAGLGVPMAGLGVLSRRKRKAAEKVAVDAGAAAKAADRKNHALVEALIAANHRTPAAEGPTDE